MSSSSDPSNVNDLVVRAEPVIESAVAVSPDPVSPDPVSPDPVSPNPVIESAVPKQVADVAVSPDPVIESAVPKQVPEVAVSPDLVIESAVPKQVAEVAVSPNPVIESAVPKQVAEADVGPEPVANVSETEQLTTAFLALNLYEQSVREAVEKGLQAFNAIQNACEIIDGAIRSVDAIQSGLIDNSVKLHFNPSIGLLADFVRHCKLLVSANGIDTEPIVAAVKTVFGTLIADARFQSELYKDITVEEALVGKIGTQISLVLRIGEVFNVPVFTVYVIRDVFNNAVFDSDEVVAPTIAHNSKTIANCSRLDFMLELLLHATMPAPYDEVNALIANITHTLFVSKFADSNPNEVIATECAKLFALILPEANATATPMFIKTVLIAIIQNPAIKTDDGKRFSDMFPSGQYIKYFGEVAYRATPIAQDQGPIMIDRISGPEGSSSSKSSGDAPGLDEEEEEEADRMRMMGALHPLTRTEIIVAALTAANKALGSRSNIVAAGGAAVSYYIKDFVDGMEADEFASIIADSGLKTDDLEALKQGCDNIRMNDIDCFVFGEVSRQFLLMFSLYMMVLYANFYERPQQLWRYGTMNQDTRIKFNLAPASSDNVQLFMYGNRHGDANTKLISKRLKKNPKVQLVSQETMCFSQLVNPMCHTDGCTVDGYYVQPIDLVKKEIGDFIVLYDSLYPLHEDHVKPDLKALLESQYSTGADNMVSVKTTMLDLVCIFCNEDKALFIRIFMARKNPKDFARLRVFIEIYLLLLLRKNDATFLAHKDDLIREIVQLRGIMRGLNELYYSEQGNIAAVQAETATKLNADRTVFLQLLRSIGRRIVLIPDPLDNAIPATFRAKTGMNTIRFFKSIPNPQIKYPFDMMAHMSQFCTIYYAQFRRDNAQLRAAYDSWMSDVISQLRFNEESTAFFREKLRIILDNGDGNIELDFKHMPVKSPHMLELLTALKGIKMDEAKLKQMNKFKALRSNLLYPLREFIEKQGGLAPSATYVIKLYDKSTINDYLIGLVRYALLKDESQNNSGLIKIISEPANYDDAVREEIGRILLEWNALAPSQLGGGSTRKRKRVCRLKNARTRAKPRSIKRRNTRRKIKANKLRFNRTHR